MISLTHGEGFGRPLLEATMTGLPVIASNWSGQLDFLCDKKSILLGGDLIDVPKSQHWKNIIIPESKWFNVNENLVYKSLNYSFEGHDMCKEKAVNLMKENREKFTLKNMSKKLNEIIEKIHIPDAPTQVNVSLPTEEAQVMQCINCGYTTTTKFNGTKETNEEYQKLTDDMKKWSKEENNCIWIPSIITLPIGMLYPIDEGEEMKWSFAPMVNIPEDEREKYPNPQGGFYEKKIDVDNPIIYDKFINGISYINELTKKISEKKEAKLKPSKINLPKLKKK